MRMKTACVMGLAPVLVGLCAPAWSTASEASAAGNAIGAEAAKAAHATKPPVKPCKSSLTQVLQHPKAPLTNYLFSPATGAKTPQDAMKKVVGSENERGLIAICPYITSEEVFDVVQTAVLFTGGATPSVMVRTLENGVGGPTEKVTIGKLHCTGSKCSATVTSSSTIPGSSGSSTETVQTTRYGSGWFVSQYLLSSASGST